MIKNKQSAQRRYRVEVSKRCVTTVVYLENKTVITKVFYDGNIEVEENPP